MKIVHITWVFTFGGIETMLVNICNEQVKLGHDVHLIIMQDSSVESTLYNCLDKRINIHYGHRKEKGKLIIPVILLNILLLKINPNVIHVHSSSMYKLILFPKYRKITNATLHALPKPQNTKSIELVPRIFSISDAVRNELITYNGTNSITIPNGIHPQLIKTRPLKDWIGILQLVQVSRLDHEDKGQHILLYAGAELIKKGFENFMITFIGDGASRTYLEELTVSLGLKKNVTFLGMKSQSYIFEHLCDYDVFVQPSIREGFGNTVAEAMAAKLGIIVSSGQGPEEIVDYGKYGLVFENGNPNDCADKIMLYLEHKINLQQINDAYQHVLECYDIKETVKAYLNHYVKSKYCI